MSNDIIAGIGVGTPRGILNASGVPVCGTSSAAPDGQLSWQNVVALKYELPIQLHQGASYFMNQRTFGRDQPSAFWRAGKLLSIAGLLPVGVCLETMKYFAYGSNMYSRRLRERVGSCEFVTVAKLLGYKLCFHKRSNDKSAKCDAFQTGSPADAIWGVVFTISLADKRALDEIEGLGSGYNEKEVSLMTPAGEHLKAVTYYADNAAVVKGLPPYTWYKDLI